MKNLHHHDLINKDFWLPLDNAAKIFPAIRSREHSTVFRLSVILKENIQLKSLTAAIEQTEKRFPYFRVRLRRGFFWYYLEYTGQHIVPVKDHSVLCRAFLGNEQESNLLFRVLVIKNRISVEFTHILTDGAGGFLFFKMLLIAYFREKGFAMQHTATYEIESSMQKEEFEDAYNRFFQQHIPPVLRYSKAFHLPFPLKARPRFDVIVSELPLREIKTIAQTKGVSITEYLVAVYLFVLQEIYSDLQRNSRFRKHNKLRIQVPVNLRNIYPSKTMRNFSLFVLPEIDLRLGQYSFDEIVKVVYHKMHLETDEKLINKIISRNVSPERKIFVRSMPLFLKSMVLRRTYYKSGADQYSGVITNLGLVKLPDEITKRIDSFVFIPPPPNKKLKVNCGIIGFNDKLILSFGNISQSKELEKKFFRFFSDRGIKIRLLHY